MWTHRRGLAFVAAIHLSVIASARADDPHRPDPQTVALAARPVGGPWAETANGVALLPTALFLAWFATVAAGPPWFACWDEPAPARERCERKAHAQERRAARLGLGVGLSVALLGAGLITHGAYRVRRIRHARRIVAAFEGAALEVSSNDLALGATFRF